VLELWDAIFAEDPSLNIVEYICLVLLIRIRDKSKQLFDLDVGWLMSVITNYMAVMDGEYAECLTLLMRYPPIKEPIICVEQARYLRQNLTEEACLQILRQNDVKAGKPPRETIGLERPKDPRQRRANQAGRSGPPLPSDGISKLTKDMMQNPQIREINRALVGVMGAVQVIDDGKKKKTIGRQVF